MSSYDAAIVDVTILEDPRLLTLPRSWRLLHLEALVWSRSHRTDGAIPRHLLSRIAFDEPERIAAAEALVEAGLWEDTPTGWMIADFLATQWSREKVERKRELARERYHRWQEGSGPKKDKRVSRRGSNGVANDPYLTRPDPNRRVGGREGRSGADSGEPEAPVVAVRPVEERIADARRLLADPSTHPKAREAAAKQLSSLGMTADLEPAATGAMNGKAAP